MWPPHRTITGGGNPVVTIAPHSTDPGDHTVIHGVESSAFDSTPWITVIAGAIVLLLGSAAAALGEQLIRSC
jgi:hypothetical protein